MRSDTADPAVANAIANLGCPNSDLPSDTEIVVAQGEVTAPAGTTAPTWELSINGNVVLEDDKQVLFGFSATRIPAHSS